MMTGFLASIAPYIPAVLSWVVRLAAKVFVEKAKGILKKRSQLTAYRNAISRALTAFSSSHPELVSSFFDEHFVRSVVADEMLKFLTRGDRPNPTKIADAYWTQFRKIAPEDILPAIEAFLLQAEQEFKAEEELQSLLTHRQTDESVMILRRLDAANNDLHKRVPTKVDIETLQRAFDIASQVLVQWPQLIDDRHWIERPELERLIDRIDTTANSVSLLLGSPGSGKSAILSRLGSDGIARGWAVLAVKADQLPEDLSSLEDLRRYLALPGPVADCLREVATEKRTVLLIDQLDALSELLDLKTKRLQVLLRLMNEVKTCPGVHIVCSCRSFDRSYDSRLNSIDAEEMLLDLPNWTVVEKILESKDINAGQWPAAFREILRVPQCLKLFIRHFSGTSEQRVFESYQAMLEHLWSDRLLGPHGVDGTTEVLVDIATEMAEREVMFVPAAKYDQKRRAVDHAVQTGFLQYDPTGRQITFSHQTIFDFARARAFISKEQSLSKYVLARQSGLYVRPKLWSALHYLRGSDPQTYEAELSKIWCSEGLRLHIRMLLIDFLGMQEAPSGVEVKLLGATFGDPTYGPHTFAAVAGRKAWFALLDKGYLASAMANNELAWPADRVLEAAWDFAPKRVLELVSTYWARDKDRANLAWHCLRSVKQWDRETLSAAIAMVQAGYVHSSAVHDLSTLISPTAPDLAAELVGAQLKVQVDAAITTRPPPIEVPEDASYERHLSAHLQRHNADDLRKVIESSSEWYELPAVAEAAPKAYLRSAWPHVRRALELLAGEAQANTSTYRPDHLSATRLEVDSEKQDREYPLMDSFVYAVRALADQDLSALQQFVAANDDSESATVQRLIAIGLCQAASSMPQLAFDYLLGDMRRLSLENFHEDERETKMLLRAVLPHLDGGQVQKLEQYILEADIFEGLARGKEPHDRLYLKKRNRQFQLRLLLQFPKERLSKETQDLIESEHRLFPGFKDDRREIEVFATGSAMKAKAMEQASVRNIQAFLSSVPDSTNWGDDGFTRRHGGSIQASREFAEFAKKDPKKALVVINSLDPGTHQRPAAYAIRELQRAELPDEDLLALIKTLDAKGFNGWEFRESCADALSKRVGKDVGLPEDAIHLFEKWLDEYSVDASNGSANEVKSSNKKGRNSLLWGHGGIQTLPHGSYPILSAWFFGLLLRNPLDSGRLLLGLRRHLARQDNIDVWKAMAADTLSRLRFLDHDESAKFVDELFTSYPPLFDDRQGLLLIAHCLQWAPHQLTATWIERVRTQPFEHGRQAFGELATLRSVLLKDDKWSEAALSQILDQPTAEEEPEELIGAIFAAANLWTDAKNRTALTRILCRGMDSSHPDAAAAAIDWFSHVNELRLDADSRLIVEAFAAGRSLEIIQINAYVLDRMSDVIDDAPDLVFEVSRRLLEVFKSEIGNLASGAALQSEAMLSIALTLQRQTEPHRSRGLDLFEQLLRYEAYKAKDVLFDIDRRPGAAIALGQLRMRRRRRRKR
jgi:DNA replication protein DnaC